MNWRRGLLLLSLFLITTSIWAQTPGAGQAVVVNPYPARNEPTKLFFYSASNGTLLYICYTTPTGPWNNNSVAASFSWTKAATTLTNIVVLTNTGTVTTSTAHGLQIGNSVTVTGATVDTDLNATYIVQTVPSTTTFTITTVAVANATYVDSGMVLTTSVPRTTVGIWAINQFRYDDSSNTTSPTASLWAGTGSGSFNNICANRATLSYR